MNPQVILILSAMVFILIALVGGGIEAKEVKLPRLATWARIVSALLGVGLFALAFVTATPPDQRPPGPETPPDRHERILYEDHQQETSVHGLRLLSLSAMGAHDPPRLYDRLTVEFELKNVSGAPIKLVDTFVAARNPSGEKKNFGLAETHLTLQPNETVRTRASQILDAAGKWVIGPGYALGEDWTTAAYPGEWSRFPVHVEATR
ncbi:hypothetical protein NR798_33585 [Archangium gephyra]|uniref:hypothetical protein n=1 Tax=Archangium gephyra TaxID=48 RepID=UPI0035D4F056